MNRIFCFLLLATTSFASPTGESPSVLKKEGASTTLLDKKVHHRDVRELDLAKLIRSARAFEHQVAGHDGILSTDDGLIIKPCRTNEANFYNLDREKHKDMTEFMPKFYGAVSLDPKRGVVGEIDVAERNVQNFIALENVLHRFRKPSVMDIKLGTQTHDDFSTEAKKERKRAMAARTTSLKLGLRLSGIKVHNPISGEYVKYNKAFGKSLTRENVNSGIKKYFKGAKAYSKDYHRNVVLSFISRLQHLQKVMSGKEFRLYATSLLFVYEGEPTPEEAAQAAKVTDLRMIDFARSHYAEGQGVDEGYIFGLKNTMALLKRLI